MGRDSFALSYQSEEEMFRADIVMLETLSLLLREAQDLPGSLSELVKAVSIHDTGLPFDYNRVTLQVHSS